LPGSIKVGFTDTFEKIDTLPFKPVQLPPLAGPFQACRHWNVKIYGHVWYVFTLYEMLQIHDE
jgi:hypothetical protein